MSEYKTYTIPCTKCETEMTEARNFDKDGRPTCPECSEKV